MRTSLAIARGLETSARSRRRTTLASTRLFLQTVEHLAGGERSGGSRYRMNADKEQKLGLVRGDHGDDEPVTGSGVRMGARRRPGLHKSIRMIQRLADSLPGTVAGRLRHSGKYFANDGLISAVVQLEVGASHFDRGDGPAITKAHQRRSGQSSIGRIECKAVCYGNQLFARQILGQRAEIGIARDRNGSNKI